MNPFKVQKIIKESHEKGERLIIEELSKRCGVQLRHRHVIMSKQMFECEACGGFPRHWVTALHPLSYFTLWTYRPPKVTDFSPIARKEALEKFSDVKNREIKDMDSERDIQSINEVLK